MNMRCELWRERERKSTGIQLGIEPGTFQLLVEVSVAIVSNSQVRHYYSSSCNDRQEICLTVPRASLFDALKWTSGEQRLKAFMVWIRQVDVSWCRWRPTVNKTQLTDLKHVSNESVRRWSRGSPTPSNS